MRVAVIGCGTSLFIARAFAARREALGQGETDAFAASEFPFGRRYHALVALSRSGTTTEVLDLLGRIDGRASTTVVTAAGDTPVSSLAGRTIVLDFADERSVVQTRFATSTLALLRAHLGDDLDEATADAESALADPLPALGDLDHFVFLGHGWSVGIAEEAALKLREAAQAQTEAYPAMEYRHGPISLSGPRSLVWIFGTPDAAVADDVAATGATVRVASRDAMAELVLVHRLAVVIAEARRLDPDHPRHLTRSVVLRQRAPVANDDVGRMYLRDARGDGSR